MASHHPDRVSYYRKGMEDTSRAVVHHGVHRTDSPGGAASGGQDQIKSASGSFSQHPTGSERYEDDLCHVYLELEGRQFLLDIKLDFSDCTHMKTSPNTADLLKRKLHDAGVYADNFDEKNSAFYCVYNGRTLLKSEKMKKEKMRVVCETLGNIASSLHKISYSLRRDIKIPLLKALSESYVFKSKTGTYHETAGDMLLMICEKENKTKVEDEFKSILNAVERNHCQKPSPEEENLTYYDAKFYLRPELVTLLEGSEQALPYIVSQLEGQGLSCEFLSRMTKVHISGHGEDQLNLEEIFHQYHFVRCIQYPHDTISEMVDAENLLAIVRSNLSQVRRKSCVFLDSTSANLIIIGTDDVEEITDQILRKIFGSVNWDGIHVDKLLYRQVLEKWKEADPHTANSEVNLKQSKSFGSENSPQLSEETESFLKYPDTSQSLQSVQGLSPVDQSRLVSPVVKCRNSNIEKVKLSGERLTLFKIIPHSQEFVRQRLHQESYDFEVDVAKEEARLMFSKPDDRSLVLDLFNSCLKEKIIDFKQVRYAISPSEAKSLLMKRESKAEKQLVVTADDEQQRLTIVGTADVFEIECGALVKVCDGFKYMSKDLTIKEHAVFTSRKITDIESHFDEYVRLTLKGNILQIHGAQMYVQKCIQFVQPSTDNQGLKKDTKPKSVQMKECHVPVSPYKYAALSDKNISVHDYLEDKFNHAGYCFQMVPENEITVLALSDPALERAKNLINEQIHERKLQRDAPVWLMLSSDGIERELLSSVTSHQGRVKVFGDEQFGGVIVCTDDVVKEVDKELERLRTSYSLETINFTESTLEKDTATLGEELKQFDPNLAKKVKIFQEGGNIVIVGRPEDVTRGRERIEVLIRNQKRKDEISTGIKQKAVQLSDEELQLIESPRVIDYIDKKLRDANLIMTLCHESKSIIVSAVTDGGAERGAKTLKSCIKQHIFSLKDDPVLKRKTLEDIKQMFYDSQDQEKSVMLQNDQELILICTDDVFKGTVEKCENILKSCTVLKDKLLCTRTEIVAFISRFFKSDLHDIEGTGVQVTKSGSGDTYFKISGHKQSLVQEAKKKLQDLCSRITVKEYPLTDEKRVLLLKSEEGKIAIDDVEQQTKSLIHLEEDAEKKIDKKGKEGAEEEDTNRKYDDVDDDDDEDNDDVDVDDDDEDDEEDEEDDDDGGVEEALEAFKYTEDEPCWQSKDGKSQIHIIECDPLQLDVDILAVPFLEGNTTTKLESYLEKGALKEQWNEIYQQSKRKQSQKDHKRSLYFSGAGNFKCRHLAFCHLPTWDSGKEKEKTRTTIEFLIDDCVRKAASSVGIFLSFPAGRLFCKIAKQIVYVVREKLKNLTTTSPLKILLLAEDDRKDDLKRIWKKSRSTVHKVKKCVQKKIHSTAVNEKSTDQRVKFRSPNFKVIVGELAEQKVDIIVNSVGTNLDLSQGAVARSLNKASNSKLQQELKTTIKQKTIRGGEILVTSSAGLKCAAVCHGCLCHFPSDRKKVNVAWNIMRSVIQKCLFFADGHNYTSIAFPVLGAGILEFPSDEVVACMFNTVELFYSDNQGSSIKDVIFVVYKDNKDIARMFRLELMARIYHIIQFAGDVSGREERIEFQDFNLQVIQSDVEKCAGQSNGLLCFWNDKHCSDQFKHPVVGKYLRAMEWDENALKKLRKDGCVVTPSGGLPAEFVINALLHNNEIYDALHKGLHHASQMECPILQIVIPSNGKVSDVKRDLEIFASELCHCLQDKDIQKGSIRLITLLISSADAFNGFVTNLREEVKNVGKWSVKNFFKGAASLVGYGGGASDHQQHEIKCPKLIITATSEKDHYDANFQIMEWLCDMQSKSEFGTTINSKKQGTHHNDRGHQTRTELKWKNTIYHLLIEDSDQWVDKFNKSDVQDSVVIINNEEKTFMEGDLENIVLACQFMKENYGIEPMPQQTGARPKSVLKIRTGVSISVKHEQFMAAKHFLGDKVSEFCDVKNDPDKSGNLRVSFKCTRDNKDEAESIQQRIEGVIQEELPVPDTDWSRGTAVAAGAMKGTDDVYIKYQEDTHTMLLFAEDWDNMSKAKKRVQLQFGQAKVSSRTRRKFAGPSTVPLERSESTEEKVTDVNTFQGKFLLVKVYKDDITTLHLDVVVNAANGRLYHGGGVARAIQDKAGYKLTREGNDIVRKGNIPVTQLAVTTGGDLPCQKVFHAVGPRWDDYVDKKMCLEDLCYTVLRCLCEARNRGFTSIVFPSISASIFAVPQEKCAQMYVRALKSFDATADTGTLKEVHFVDVTDKMVSVIQKELEKNWKQPCDQASLDTDFAFIKDNIKSIAGPDLGPSKSINIQIGKNEGNLKYSIHQFSDNVSLQITKADIFQQTADAIVSWEDFTFSAERYLIQQMLKIGGEHFKKERQKAFEKMKNLGEVDDRNGGNLPQKNVIFALVSTQTRQKDLQTVLGKIYIRCQQNFSTLILPVFKLLEIVPGKSNIALFIESVVESLIVLTQQGNSQALKILIIDKNQQIVDELTRKLYDCCVSRELLDKKSRQETDISGENCTICLSTPTNPKRLKCGDVFCKLCIDKAFEIKKVCPNCGVLHGKITGTMPKGTMTEWVENKSLPGYEGFGTIVINYYFTGGIQSPEHPNPGKYFQGTKRTAYLPNIPEGQKVLALLKVAFERRLTFTVGRSVTIQDGGDRVTWNEIHHKTNIHGGPTEHGYPDPDYLRRVQEELAAQGVTEADLGATGTAV